jgi:hypothetical protein
MPAATFRHVTWNPPRSLSQTRAAPLLALVLALALALVLVPALVVALLGRAACPASIDRLS